MKTADDFRRALGEGDEAFTRCVEKTLAALPREEPIMKRKISVGLAIAFVLLMMTIAAMAANWWGISDFLKNDNIKGMSQEMGVTAETEHATFTVTEHIYDGRGIYMVVAVRPKEDTLLLPQGMDEDAWIGGMVPDAGQMTVAEYAEQKGCADFVWVAVNTNLQEMGQETPYLSRREHLEEDGTLMLMLSGVKENLPEALHLTLDCGSKKGFIGDNSGWQDAKNVSRGQMQVDLFQNAADEKWWHSLEPVVYDALGMTVEEVRLVQTPLATYYEIDYTAHDPQTNQRDSRRTPGYMFRFVTEEGKSLPVSGVANQARYVLLDKDNGRGRWIGTLTADVVLSDGISLKGILGDFTHYDAKEIKRIPLISAE